MPRVSDGRCIWCNRKLPLAEMQRAVLEEGRKAMGPTPQQRAELKRGLRQKLDH